MNNTLRNGFMVLEYLAATGSAYSVKSLADEFKMPNSHVCRLLKSLVQTGYVEQDPSNRKYRISIKVLALSNACLTRMQIRNRVRPFLDRLSHEVECQVFLSVPLHGKPMIVDVVYPNGFQSDPSLTIGAFNPIHASASGKICAAFLPEEQLDELLKGYSFERLTDKTIADPGSFKKELEKVRNEQVATTNSERGPGIMAVAAPVFDCDGNFVGAVGFPVPTQEMTDQKWGFYKTKIRETAEAASFALGYARNRFV